MMDELAVQANREGAPKALIVGRAGFLGSHLADSLLAQGCRVVIFSDDPSLATSKELAHLVGNKNFRFLSSWPEESFNYAFFLEEKWWEKREKIKAERWLLFLSHLPEEHSYFSDSHLNLRLVVAKQVFGPRQSPQEEDFFSSWWQSILTKKEIVLAGDGSFKIYPLYVVDLVRGLTAAMFMPHSRQQTFYFAGEEMTAFSFAKIFSDQWPEISIKFQGKDIPFPPPYLSLVARTKEELVWKASTPLVKAVKATISWLKNLSLPSLDASFVSQEKINPTRQEQEKEASSLRKNETSSVQDDTQEEISSFPVAPISFSLPVKKEKEEKANEEEDFFDIRRLSDHHLQKEFLSSSSPAPVSPSPRKLSRWGKWGGIFFLILVFLFPFLSLGIFTFMGVGSIKRGESYFREGNFSQARLWSRRAQKAFGSAYAFQSHFSFLWRSLLGEAREETMARYLEAGEKGGALLEKTARGSEKIAQAAGIIFSSQNGDLVSLLDEGENDLKNAYFDFNDFLLLSRQLKWPSFFSLGDEQEKFAIALEKGIRSFPLWKDFLSKQRQTILILFQNNMELRPSGGFIGSYGLLVLEQGKLIDFTVHDVYEADGQLHGHVEPPETLKKYLGESSWYLRDANWSPDFPTVARQAMWFLEKETSQSVDGVWAINLNAVKKMLAHMKGVYLPDYKEEINENNLFERAEYYAEVGFFPGSTQKRDFLASLAFALLEEVKKKPSLGTALSLAFQESLEKKDIIFYFADDSLEKKVLELGWGGNIKEVSCLDQKSCLADYLWPVEANVGANKANFFIKRSLAQKLMVNDSGLVHTVRLTYENTAQTNTWPGGNYKNFLRLLLPVNAQIEGVFVEDEKGKRTRRDNWEEEIQGGKKIVGFLLEVPIKSKRTIEVNYSLKSHFQGRERHLVFLFQKQGGSEFDQDMTLISYPPDWLPLSVFPEETVKGQAIIYRRLLNDGDLLFKIKWGK